MFNNILKEHVQLLNEQYYGKNSKTLEMEQIFLEMKNELEEGIMGEIPQSKITKYEKKLEKCFQDLFNFKYILLEIKNIGSINAYTYSKTVEDLFNAPLTNKEENKKYGGIQYTDKANRSAHIIIALEMIRKDEISPAMLVGVLLHEIGHNFFIEDSISFRCDIALLTLSLPYRFLHDPTSLTKVTNTGRIISTQALDYLRDFKIYNFFKNIDSIDQRIRSYYDDLQYIKRIFKYGLFIRNGFKAILDDFVLLVNLPQRIISKNSLYSNELYANNFATSYGYGKEVAEFAEIYALDTTGYELLDSFRNISFITKLSFDFILNINKIVNQFNPFNGRVDTAATEMIDQLEYLKSNLKSVKSPEKRKAIENDIQHVEDVINEFEKRMDQDKALLTTKLANKAALKMGGEISYKLQKKKYDDNGNWKNLI